MIGESCILYTEDITAREDCAIAHVTRKNFEAWIGGRFQDIQNDNEALGVLKNVELLKGLSNEKLMQLIHALNVSNYSDGEHIV